MGLTDDCSCQVNGCSRSWSRHPILEVECEQCGAEVGSLCRRPSGHTVNSTHGKYHTQRYYDALDEGHFGDCPMDRCPESSAESKEIKRRNSKGQTSSPEDTTEQAELPV